MINLKVLILGMTDRIGGVETFIFNSTIYSDRNEIQFDYLVHDSKEAVFRKEINNFYDDREHFFFVPKIKKNPFKTFKVLFRFYWKNRDVYDWVHLQTGSAAEIVYVVPFIFFTRAKLIIHSHNGNGYSNALQMFFSPIVKMAAKKKLTVSDEASKWMYGSERDVITINNGVDTERFKFNREKRTQIRKEYNVEDAFLIGHIGRFSEQKNHKYLVEIFKIISMRNEKAKLILLGEGELESKIKAQIREKNLVDKVIFAGIKNNTEDYYSAFDAFVLPSTYEGLPIVGIEAQTSGVPCFFSDGISKQILISKNSYMISLKETAAYWASEIEMGCKKCNHREDMHKIIFEEGYDINETVKKLRNVYTEER